MHKNDVYKQLIAPLVEEISKTCADNSIPMMMAFCMQLEDGQDEETKIMTLAGMTYLEDHLDPPYPMLAAAAMLRIPGFDYPEDASSKVH